MIKMETFDNRLMDLSYKFRKCRESTREVTRSYPNCVQRQSEALENQMMQADLIIGGLIAMLHESDLALMLAMSEANRKEGAV